MAFTESNVDPDEAQAPEGFRKELKRLKAENKELRAAAEERDQLKRERTFTQAGVPLDDDRLPYFVAGYKGEQTPEAIRAEWDAKFGGAGHGQGQGQSQVDHELAALNNAAAMTQGQPNVPANLLAERNAKLAALSQTDRYYDEKFRSIMEEYGSKVYNPNTG